MSPAIVLALYFLSLAIVHHFEKGYIVALVMLLYIAMFAICAMAMSKKGIVIDFQKRMVIIRDDRGKHRYPFDKIKGVSLVKINKTNKGKKSWLYLFFLGAKEEIEMWEYVYHHGEVYRVIFYINSDDGGYYTYKSYFGWMYKEKSKLKVAAVSKELETFVHDLNALAKKQFNPN